MEFQKHFKSRLPITEVFGSNCSNYVNAIIFLKAKFILFEIKQTNLRENLYNTYLFV